MISHKLKAMLKEEQHEDIIFLAQTTFYIYRNEKDRQDDMPFLCTSSEVEFERVKNSIKSGERKLRKE